MHADQNTTKIVFAVTTVQSISRKEMIIDRNLTYGLCFGNSDYKHITINRVKEWK